MDGGTWGAKLPLPAGYQCPHGAQVVILTCSPLAMDLFKPTKQTERHTRQLQDLPIGAFNDIIFLSAVFLLSSGLLQRSISGRLSATSLCLCVSDVQVCVAFVCF